MRAEVLGLQDWWNVKDKAPMVYRAQGVREAWKLG